ncbi:MAG: hypothetical protein L3J52_03280 [Proteobacteria bacterium]|nr:hypothetical protein [Pseudomonadota bacterium]
MSLKIADLSRCDECQGSNQSEMDDNTQRQHWIIRAISLDGHVFGKLKLLNDDVFIIVQPFG